jgi:hypothetical protein
MVKVLHGGGGRYKIGNLTQRNPPSRMADGPETTNPFVSSGLRTFCVDTISKKDIPDGNIIRNTTMVIRDRIYPDKKKKHSLSRGDPAHIGLKLIPITVLMMTRWTIYRTIRKKGEHISLKFIYDTAFALLDATILLLLLATTFLVGPGKVLIALPNVSMPSVCFCLSVRDFGLYQIPLPVLYLEV